MIVIIIVVNFINWCLIRTSGTKKRGVDARMRKVVTFAVLLLVAVCPTLGYNITGNVTVVNASNPATTPLIVFAMNDTGQMYTASLDTSNADNGSLIYPYNISSVPSGNYTIKAFLDFNGNFTPDSNEPSNSTFVTVTTSDVSGVDLVLYNQSQTLPPPAGPTSYTISGLIYNTTNISVGTVEVYAFNSSQFQPEQLTAENITAVLPLADNSTSFFVSSYPALYQLQVPPGAYYVAALLDTGGNYTAIGYAINASDTFSMATVDVSLGDNTTADITLYQIAENTTSTGAGGAAGGATGGTNVTISGTIYYNGTGNLSIMVYSTQTPLTYNTLLTTPANSTTVPVATFPLTYSIAVPPGYYWVVAFLDLDNNQFYDDGEPIGFAINATSNTTATPINAINGNSSADIILNESYGFAYPSYGNYSEGSFEENFTIPTGLAYWYPETCNQSTVNVTVQAVNWSAIYNSTSNFALAFEGSCFYGVGLDANGRANISIQPGEYRVVIYETIPPYRMIEVGNYTVSEGSTVQIDFSQLDIPEIRPVTVRVVNNGNPIANAEVIVYSLTAFLGYGVTDSNGNVTINGMNGSYTAQVTIFSADYTSVQMYSFSIQINNSTSLIVLDISSLPRLKGYVLKDGQPVQGAFVNLYTDDYLVYQFASTNNSGYYEITLPSYGDYNIRVDPGFSDEFFIPSEEHLTVNSTLTAGYYNITVGFENAAKLSGYVRGGNTPLAGVMVWAFSEDTYYYADTFTNSTGYYELELPAGTYEVHFDPTTIPGNIYTEHVETVSLTADVTLPVTLSAGNLLEGWIVDSSGQPISCSYGCGWIVAYGESGWNSAEVDSNGYYSMALSDGEYTIEFYPYSSSYTVVRDTVNVLGNTMKNLTVSQGYTLSGTVTKNGLPVSSADVTLYRAGTSELAGWTATDSNGNFVMGGLESGNYRIEIYSPSAGYYSADLTISGDMDLSVDMSSVGGYTLTGTILPSGSADVYVYNEQYSFSTSTDDGSFSISGIPAGDYNVRIYHYGLDVGMTFNVSITGDTSQTFDFSVTSTSDLSNVTIQVLNTTGSPISGASVSIYSDQTGESGVTGADGSVTFELPNGDYTLTIQADGYYINTTQLTVSGDTSVTIGLQTTQTQSGSGTITVNVSSNYGSDETIWITIKDQNAFGDRYYSDVVERDLPAGDTISVSVDVPAGTYKVAVLYPIYSGGELIGVGEVYQLNVTVPGAGTLEFTVPST